MSLVTEVCLAYSNAFPALHHYILCRFVLIVTLLKFVMSPGTPIILSIIQRKKRLLASTKKFKETVFAKFGSDPALNVSDSDTRSDSGAGGARKCPRSLQRWVLRGEG